MSITFETFKEHLQTLHKMEMNTMLEWGPMNDGQMMYNNEEDLGNGFFLYEYDFMSTVILRFNEDGSVDEWFEMLFEDIDPAEPNQHSDNVEEWMKKQIEVITP